MVASLSRRRPKPPVRAQPMHCPWRDGSHEDEADRLGELGKDPRDRKVAGTWVDCVEVEEAVGTDPPEHAQTVTCEGTAGAALGGGMSARWLMGQNHPPTGRTSSSIAPNRELRVVR